MGIITADDWIGQLPPALRDEIARSMTLEQISPGRELHAAGDMPRSIFRLEQGYVRLTSLQEDGRQVLLTIYAPGACFAETAVVAQRPLNHTTVAMTDVRVAKLPVSTFWDLYNRHRELPDALCRKFAQSIARQMAAREMRVQLKLGEQVSAMFGELAVACGVARPGGSRDVTLPLTQTDIAEHLDVTRQSIQREMTALKQGGLVRKSGGVWIISDRVRMDADVERELA
jgi:CRP-like cAMP-binding protein